MERQNGIFIAAHKNSGDRLKRAPLHYFLFLTTNPIFPQEEQQSSIKEKHFGINIMVPIWVYKNGIFVNYFYNPYI